MAFIIIVIGIMGMLNLDSLWRGTRWGDIVNAIAAIIAFVVLAAFVVGLATMEIK